MAYYLIHNSDGNTYIREINPSEFLVELAGGGYGDSPNILHGIPQSEDTNYWGDNAYLIIKGDIVFPKPKKIVESFEF